MAGDLLPYFKMYPAETLADERFGSWTLAERGAWVSLLLHAWVNGSIPSDLDSLARILHVDADAMRSHWARIGDRFTSMDHLPPDRLSSPRLERERDEALARVEGSKKAAKTRWRKPKSPDASALRPHSARNATAMPADQIRSEQSRAAAEAPAAARPQPSKPPTDDDIPRRPLVVVDYADTSPQPTSDYPLAEKFRTLISERMARTNPYPWGAGAETMRAIHEHLKRWPMDAAVEYAYQRALAAERKPKFVSWFASVLEDDVVPLSRPRPEGENPKPGDPDFNDQDAWDSFDAFLKRDGRTARA